MSALTKTLIGVAVLGVGTVLIAGHVVADRPACYRIALAGVTTGAVLALQALVLAWASWRMDRGLL